MFQPPKRSTEYSRPEALLRPKVDRSGPAFCLHGVRRLSNTGQPRSESFRWVEARGRSLRSTSNTISRMGVATVVLGEFGGKRILHLEGIPKPSEPSTATGNRDQKLDLI